MKRKLLTTTISLTFLTLAVAAACAPEEEPYVAPGGGTGGSGGSSTSGASTAGSSTAGTPAAGGSSTAGSSTGGMAGTPAGGTGGAGGAPVGGSAGSGGMAPMDLVEAVTGKKNANGFAVKDSWHIIPCVDKAAHDCYPIVGGGCPNQDAGLPFLDKGVKFEEEFEVGGEMGKSYDVTIRVNGISEAKYYRNGMRAAGENNNDGENSAEGQNTWYVGGEPIPSSYNVVGLYVIKPDGTPLQHYFLNSFPQNSNNEAHETFTLGYDATFEVIGGGKIRYLNQDSNCRAINNCGIGDNGSACDNARNIPNEPGLMLPDMYGGKSVASMNAFGGKAQPFHAQAIHITVKSVVAK